MSRYERRISFKVIEREFPHIVELIVPLRGFRGRLEGMYEWHRTRGVPDRHGRGRRLGGRDIVAWCFKDAATAAAFAAEFSEFVLSRSEAVSDLHQTV